MIPIHTEDTIVAICTPPGEGGIGIIRLSGPQAIPIAQQLFTSSSAKTVQPGGQRVYHGHIHDRDDVRIDEVLLHVMPGPRTYTREDVVEINAHGGTGPLNAILEECLHHGACLAGPGEFTRRAFLNGRIDLVQAEAVIDQIRARTRGGLQAANAAATGTLSKALHAMQETLRFALSRLEAAVDFPEDDLPELVDPALIAQLEQSHTDMLDLLDTADAGRLYREGAAIAIAGRPNVGKSSLFNALLRDARAIVSAHPGTTRDRLEEYITLSGVPVKLIDTAGVRHTEDEVERIGVAMARDTLKSVNMALLVLDGAEGYGVEDEALAAELATLDIPVLLILNKSDLAPAVQPPTWAHVHEGAYPISALTGDGLKALEHRLGELILGGANLAAGQAMLNRMHQKDSLRRAADCIERLLTQLDLSPEFLALEVQEALQAIGEITGETTPDDILATIFNSFCIGK